MDEKREQAIIRDEFREQAIIRDEEKGHVDKGWEERTRYYV